MDLIEFFTGRERFRTAEEIVGTTQQWRPREPRESAASAEALLIFLTSKQQTWLVATNCRLYCVLDDLPKASTKTMWVMPKEKLVTAGKVTVPIFTHEKSDRTGLVDIGERKRWLFSRKLFASEPIETRIRRLIAGRMIEAAVSFW